MTGVSGSGDVQDRQPEQPQVEPAAKAKEAGAGEKINPGFDQNNSVSQVYEDSFAAIIASQEASAPVLPATTIPGATVVSSEDIQGLQAKAMAIRDLLGLQLSGEGDERMVDGPSKTVSEETLHRSGGGGEQSVSSDITGTGTLAGPVQQSSDIRQPQFSPLQKMVSRVQAGLAEAADPDVPGTAGVYESNVRQLAESIQQTPGAELSSPLQALSIVAAANMPLTGSLALQRVIDNIVSLDHSSKGASVNGTREGQLDNADLYGIPEHVRIRLLSKRLGIDLDPLVRHREQYLDGIITTQQGLFLSLQALSTAEFLEKLQDMLREDQARDELQREAVEKLKQAIAALKAGDPKFAAEILNSASLITTSIEQIVAKYTSDETPGSLRQHLKEQLDLALDSVIREGSHQNMMKKRLELVQSATRV